MGFMDKVKGFFLLPPSDDESDPPPNPPPSYPSPILLPPPSTSQNPRKRKHSLPNLGARLRNFLLHPGGYDTSDEHAETEDEGVRRGKGRRKLRHGERGVAGLVIDGGEGEGEVILGGLKERVSENHGVQQLQAGVGVQGGVEWVQSPEEVEDDLYGDYGGHQTQLYPNHHGNHTRDERYRGHFTSAELPLPHRTSEQWLPYQPTNYIPPRDTDTSKINLRTGTPPSPSPIRPPNSKPSSSSAPSPLQKYPRLGTGKWLLTLTQHQKLKNQRLELQQTLSGGGGGGQVQLQPPSTTSRTTQITSSGGQAQLPSTKSRVPRPPSQKFRPSQILTNTPKVTRRTIYNIPYAPPSPISDPNAYNFVNPANQDQISPNPTPPKARPRQRLKLMERGKGLRELEEDQGWIRKRGERKSRKAKEKERLEEGRLGKEAKQREEEARQREGEVNEVRRKREGEKDEAEKRSLMEKGYSETEAEVLIVKGKKIVKEKKRGREKEERVVRKSVLKRGVEGKTNTGSGVEAVVDGSPIHGGAEVNVSEGAKVELNVLDVGVSGGVENGSTSTPAPAASSSNLYSFSILCPPRFAEPPAGLGATKSPTATGGGTQNPLFYGTEEMYDSLYGNPDDTGETDRSFQSKMGSIYGTQTEAQSALEDVIPNRPRYRDWHAQHCPPGTEPSEELKAECYRLFDHYPIDYQFWRYDIYARDEMTETLIAECWQLFGRGPEGLKAGGGSDRASWTALASRSSPPLGGLEFRTDSMDNMAFNAAIYGSPRLVQLSGESAIDNTEIHGTFQNSPQQATQPSNTFNQPSLTSTGFGIPGAFGTASLKYNTFTAPKRLPSPQRPKVAPNQFLGLLPYGSRPGMQPGETGAEEIGGRGQGQSGRGVQLRPEDEATAPDETATPTKRSFRDTSPLYDNTTPTPTLSSPISKSIVPLRNCKPMTQSRQDEVKKYFQKAADELPARKKKKAEDEARGKKTAEDRMLNKRKKAPNSFNPKEDLVGKTVICLDDSDEEQTAPTPARSLAPSAGDKYGSYYG